MVAAGDDTKDSCCQPNMKWTCHDTGIVRLGKHGSKLYTDEQGFGEGADGTDMTNTRTAPAPF